MWVKKAKACRHHENHRELKMAKVMEMAASLMMM
jgi:hypothetical protein